jgi:hypothetical protein
MSKSAPVAQSPPLEITVPIRLTKSSSFEDLAVQIQGTTEKILCVVDGCNLVLFEKMYDLPTSLIFEHKKTLKSLKKQEYFYRCTITDSLYAFFLDSVNVYLRNQEESQHEGKVIVTNYLQPNVVTFLR